MARYSRKRRRQRLILISLLTAICLLLVAGVVFIMASVFNKPDEKPESQQIQQETQKEPEAEKPKEEEFVLLGEYKLSADYSNLLLVNDKKPLPKDYDYEGSLTTIPQKYIKGSLTQINKDVWPYLQAMLDAAIAEGVDIGVWSPYRSYATQKMLYDKQVDRCIGKGLDRASAEIEAATVVARPGTSEHNTGLALDINCANDSFENTAAYRWLTENAEKYGFIMRYSKEKQPLTGVIHESWHWRFVGINCAKEINKLDMCLEEYVEYLEKKN